MSSLSKGIYIANCYLWYNHIMKDLPIIDPHKVKNKKMYSVYEVYDLINYIRMLEERNEEQAVQISSLMERIVNIQSRLDFYRSATLPRDVNK